MTPVKPFYSAISGVEIRLRDIDTKSPELSTMVGDGSSFIFGDETQRVLLCQRQGDASIRIYAFRRQAETWFESVA